MPSIWFTPLMAMITNDESPSIIKFWILVLQTTSKPQCRPITFSSFLNIFMYLSKYHLMWTPYLSQITPLLEDLSLIHEPSKVSFHRFLGVTSFGSHPFLGPQNIHFVHKCQISPFSPKLIHLCGRVSRPFSFQIRAHSLIRPIITWKTILGEEISLWICDCFSLSICYRKHRGNSFPYHFDKGMMGQTFIA